MRRITRRKSSKDQDYNFITMEEVRAPGSRWISYFGPCKPVVENNFLRSAVDDIKKNKRDKYGVIRSGSQAMLYIIPNFFLLSNSKAIPHGHENAPQFWRELNGKSDSTGTEQSTGVGGLALSGGTLQTWKEASEEPNEEVSPQVGEQGEIQVATEIFEGEGGAIAPAEGSEGVQLVREVSPEEEAFRRPSPTRENQGENSDLLPALPELPYGDSRPTEQS